MRLVLRFYIAQAKFKRKGTPVPPFKPSLSNGFA